MTNKKQPQKVRVTKDAEEYSDSDKRIPRNLILQYGSGKDKTYYVTKAGLEWKANELFGGAGYSIDIEPIETDREKGIFVYKATLIVLENGAKYVNFGEATLNNTNKMMASQLLHLAVTRAECRVLRMATACGYAAYDEVQTINDGKAKPEIKNGNKPATEGQIKTIKAMNEDFEVPEDFTKQDASDTINKLAEK